MYVQLEDVSYLYSGMLGIRAQILKYGFIP